MGALTLQRVPDAVRPAGGPPAPGPEVLAQRASTFGPAASVAAPAIVDAGRPLDTATRGAMEGSFGREFGHVRVHDDAWAHDTARDLGARAYTAGDDIVFAEGAYRPETPGGQALIAHELAHTVHQGGVQMKSVGAVSTNADHGLEAEADRAALDVTAGRSAPALSHVRHPVIFRANGNPPAGGTATTPAAGPAQKLPPGMTVIKDDPPGVGTNVLVVGIPDFTMPEEKGEGAWVKAAYDEAAKGGRLVFSPLIEGERISSFKEGSATEEYLSIWLRNYGFTTTGGLAAAIHASTDARATKALADPSVAKVVKGLRSGLRAAKCDVDHIVEKQIGGSSIPSNLQLLDHEKNHASGVQTQKVLGDLVRAIRDPSMRGKGVRNLQIRLQAVTLQPTTPDPSAVIEDLLRGGAVTGKAEIKEKAEGTPVSLSAGGVGETVRIQEKGRSLIDTMERRVVPGAKLMAYTRGPGGPKSKADHVEAELDSLAVKRTGEKSRLTLTAVPGDAKAQIGAAAAGVAAEENAAADEVRVLQLTAAEKKRDIAFFYPYLSPGTLTEHSLDDKGQLSGIGIIRPSVPFLGAIHVVFGPGPDKLAMVSDIPADKLRVPIPGFRFTGGRLALALFPAFVPTGSLDFEIGPKAKPVILGDLRAKYEAGAFIATGKLRQGTALPGVRDATGEVQYHSETGWSGALKLSSSSIPGANIDGELGFTSDKAGGGFKPYAKATLTTEIKGTRLDLHMSWHGEGVAYYGHVKIKKPMPLVDSVDIDGAYENGLLFLKGEAPIKFKEISALMAVQYRRKDGEDGRFSGKADVTVAIGKATGILHMQFDQAGHFQGSGTIRYKFNDYLEPELTVEITKEGRVKVAGRAEYKKPIILLPAWPKDKPGRITFLKAGATFRFQTPLPAVNAVCKIRAEAFLEYAVGPVALVDIVLVGSLYPLEPDPEIDASISGRIALPGHVTLGGKFGASIGAEVAWGALGAYGGIDVIPKLTVEAKAELAVNAKYLQGAFSVGGIAKAQGSLKGSVDVELSATLSALYGLLTHTWTWGIGGFQTELGHLEVPLGSFSFGAGGEVTPGSKPTPAPEDIDTMEFLKGLLTRGKDEELKPHQPFPEEREYRYHGHMI